MVVVVVLGTRSSKFTCSARLRRDLTTLPCVRAPVFPVLGDLFFSPRATSLEQRRAVVFLVVVVHEREIRAVATVIRRRDRSCAGFGQTSRADRYCDAAQPDITPLRPRATAGSVPSPEWSAMI